MRQLSSFAAIVPLLFHGTTCSAGFTAAAGALVPIAPRGESSPWPSATPAPLAKRRDKPDAQYLMDLGSPEELKPKIEIHSAYVTVIDSSTSWTAPDATNVPQVVTSTVDGKESVTTKSAGVALSTDAASGDWTAIMTPAFIRKLEETVALSCTLAKRDGVPCRTFAANPQALTDVLWQPFRDVIFAELGVTVTVEQAGYAAAAFVLTSLVVKTIEDQVFNDGPSLSFGWLLPKDKVEEAKGSPTPESSDEERKDCPKDAEKPRCSMDTCQGVEVEGSPNKECSTGEHKTCECSTPIKPLYDSFGLDETFVTAQQEYIQALIEAPDVASETPEEPSDEPKPDCGKRSDDNPLRDPSQEVALSQPAMETAFKSFCESNKGKELGNGIGTMYGPDGTDKCSSCPQNFRIRAMRAISDECGDFDNKINADDCLSAYGAITNGCDTETLTAKKGGYISLGCVAWTLEGSGGLGEPKGLGDPPPAEGPDAYKMKLHQVMEGADSTLTWTVFDGEGAEVGSDKATTLNDEHDVSGIIKGAPLDLQVTISRPTYKDETNIWFTYGGLSPSWSTGTTGGKAAVSSDEGYSCGKVDPGMWRPLNGGFERDLECTYLGIED